MQCYTELVPPTAVTHAVSLPFLSSSASNLAVVKTSLLQVFQVTKVSSSGEERLVLVGEYQLAGTVTGIARVKTLETRTGGEALLLAFKDAKLSLIEWDPENHRTSTISIHYYEGENVITQPFGPDLSDCDTILTVDPTSRCAALRFGARQLAILPFRQSGDELAGDEEEGYTEEPTSPVAKRRESVQQNANGELEQTPYKASFVLPLTALDPTLAHTVHLAFLHEYREPTFGILSSQVEPSFSLLDERKDILTYTVFTLDLEQRASTNLITVTKLPSTLWKVVPLPLPIGGALLVGTNELVHVDQSGKANATAVNEFAKLESDFGMQDQSRLNIKLEGCSIDVLDPQSGEMLIATSDGCLATLTFQVMGRSINGMKVTRITKENGGSLFDAAPSCISRIGADKVFVGSDEGVSSLLGWIRPAATLNRKRSHAQMSGPDVDPEDEEAIEEEDDDLYDAAPETKRRPTSSTAALSDAAARFELKDSLLSTGPINDVCLGRSSNTGKDRLQLLVGSGRQRSSRLTGMNRHIEPAVVHESSLEAAKRVSAIRTKQVAQSGTKHDDLLFVFDGQDTKPYDISGESYAESTAPEFERDGETIDVQTLAQGSIIVQCRRSEIRTYDTNLALSQILPMVDDETDEEFAIVHLSFCDPYLLVIRDDSSVQILQVQGKEIELLESEGALSGKKWLSGCIYSGTLTEDNPALFLLSAEGAMDVLSLPDLKSVFSTPLLPQLPPVLSTDMSQRRAGTKEPLAELLVADMGQDDCNQPYLIARTIMDDIILYEPFRYPHPRTTGAWHTGLRFRKVPVFHIPKYVETLPDDENSRPPTLKTIHIGGYNAVAIPGAPPCLLLKEPSSLPKVLEVHEPGGSTSISTLYPLHRAGCERGFISIGASGELRECQLPAHTWYGTGWSVRQVNLGDPAREVRQLAYHQTRGLYAVATCRNVDFYFSEEDGRHSEQDDITLRPQVPQYSIHLVSARSQSTIHTFDLPYQETVTALQVMPLEVSENTHEQQLRIVVATAAQRGEDMPAKGAITVFDVIDVVPEPDLPESGYKLHVVAREETRGAITAIAPFTGGFVGTAQGQKIMIRGLKEDGSCLPVAFLDAQCHTHTIKTLNSRGLWLTGDAWKGLWFGGFTEEPYKLTVLGKSPKAQMEVMAAEFLPFDGSLYLLVVDANMDLQVLQYDPENPKTLNGMRLLHRSTFHIGHFPTAMMLLPSSLKPFGEQKPLANGDTNGDSPGHTPTELFHVLTTTLSGSIGLLTPLDEAAYRRLSGLQTHLTAILEHAAGLNPRAYRAIESESFGSARGVVDGSLVKRIAELGAARKADVLSRSGGDAWQLRSDLEIVAGGGLGYL